MPAWGHLHVQGHRVSHPGVSPASPSWMAQPDGHIPMGWLWEWHYPALPGNGHSKATLSKGSREIQQEEPAGQERFGKCQGSSARAFPVAAAAAECLGVLRVTAPSSSSASSSPAAWKISLRGAKERPELSQVCRETSQSPLRMTPSCTLASAGLSQPGMEVSVQDH